jgi:predicted PhzF superfamily epimerase YddE/YHI9
VIHRRAAIGRPWVIQVRIDDADRVEVAGSAVLVADGQFSLKEHP